jgi:LysM repeat protein
VTDPLRAPLVAVNFHLLEAVKRPTGKDLLAEAVRNGRSLEMFDKVNGTEKTRLALQSGSSAAEIVRSWKPGEETFRAKRERYLLYGTVPSAISSAVANAPAGTGAKPPVPRKALATKTLIWAKGDTAYRISRENNITLAELQAANPGVKFDQIKPGSKVRVPVKAP